MSSVGHMTETSGRSMKTNGFRTVGFAIIGIACVIGALMGWGIIPADTFFAMPLSLRIILLFCLVVATVAAFADMKIVARFLRRSDNTGAENKDEKD